MRHRLTVWTGFLAFLFAMVGFAQAAYADRALLIGIDRYQNIKEPLAGAPIRDLAAIQNLAITKMGYQRSDIMSLTDAGATRAAILSAMERWLIAGTKPGDRVLIYFSGHGVQIRDENGDEPDGLDEALVAYDVAVVTRTDRNGVARQSLVNTVTDDQFGALLDRLKDRDVSVIIDSCHSGTLLRNADEPVDPSVLVKTPQTLPLPEPNLNPARGGEAQSKAIQLVRGDDAVTAWFAVAAEQKAHVDTSMGPRAMSVFTRAIELGLGQGQADRDRDGVVTRKELLSFVRERSQSYCRTNKCATPMTPQIDGGRKDLALAPALQTRPGRALAAPSQQPITPVTTGAPPPKPAAKPPAATPRSPYIDRTGLVGGGRQIVEVAQALLVANPAPAPSQPRTAAPAPAPTVQVTLNQAGRYALGDSLSATVRANVSGRVLLFDISATGEMRLIYPNALTLATGADGQLRPGQPLTTPATTDPFQIVMAPPGGDGGIVAVLVQDPLNMDALLDPNRSRKIASPQAYLSELSILLDGVWREGPRARPIRWTAAIAPYSVK